MRVLLIQGYLGPNPSDSLVYPLGLSYVATALADDGHEVRICDPNAHAEGLGALRREVASWEPKVVGVSLRNIDTTDYIRYLYYYPYLEDVLSIVEDLAPDAAIIIGGTGFSTFPERIMNDHPRIDIGVVFEGETSATEVLRHLTDPTAVRGVYVRRGDDVVFTGSRRLDSYPDISWPRRDFCDLEPYLSIERAIGIQSYRGCPLECEYCNYPELNGRYVRSRSARDVVDEIEDLRVRHGVREVIFADSLFDLRRSFAREICSELIARDLDVRWSAWFETYRFDEEWFLLAKEAGCYRFCFSPDGASDATMTAMGKRCRESDVERVLEMAARYSDVAFRFTLFCSVRCQNWRDVWKSVRFVVRSHLVLANSRCLLSWTRVFPNSPLYARLVAAGGLDRSVDLLPPRVLDHRPLFHLAPQAPRLATPIVRATWVAAEWLRQVRKRLTTVERWVASRLARIAARRNVDGTVASRRGA